jgi:hypothetical protein
MPATAGAHGRNLTRGSGTSTTYKPTRGVSPHACGMTESTAAVEPVEDFAGDLLMPPFAGKIAILVRDDLPSWQRLNVTAFLASGITAAHLRLVGQQYQDADGQEYLPLLGMPVLIFEATSEVLSAVRSRALGRRLPAADRRLHQGNV